MCEGSIHVAHRKATDNEELVVKAIPNHGGYLGYYPADPSAKDQRLVCVVRSEAVIDELRIRPTVLKHMAADIKALDGLRNVKATLLHENYQDVVRIGRTEVPLAYLELGIRFRIPPTVVGVDAVKAALVEQDKLTPLSKTGRALSMTRNAIRKRTARVRQRLLVK